MMRTDTLFTAIAAVLGNWHNVLRAINMASCKYTFEITRLSLANVGRDL